MSAGGAGRFAPSPTGPLHLGSLLAAVASYLDARRAGIAWHVRLDDLDTPRHEAGADRAILLALERHGLHWDGPIVRQSERVAAYYDALDLLQRLGLLFYCRCSRRQLREVTTYPGTCHGHTEARPDSAVRVRVDDAAVEFEDLLQGAQRCLLADSGGDFVVRRRDGLVAYQLATAVDDGAGAITRVVRGRDLLDTTPRQVYLMRQLGLPVPVYAHVPLLLDAAGHKLSKQNHAPPLDLAAPARNLRRVLPVLGLEAPPETADCVELLVWAQTRFRLEHVLRDDSAL
ncbi:MAG: tRNA glutamyl-Q(34) synthetase GluQRS [Gammaproteobacteria bacterium]|nr:tRNA glutamyl-Q(34) synthetase GluQRS [Gammaproteobacteria bacterium]